MVQTGDTGGKTGSGGPASSQETEMQRKERLRKLALETIDLGKDPYILRNHLGSYECKLCLTLHRDEGNYLVHTQGKRHQTNLARRAAREAKLTTPDSVVMPVPIAKKKAVLPRRMKIGRPGYRINKLVDPETNQKSLLFHVEYPEIEEGTQPRHRFMSSFEQKIEPPDRNYQYLIFAADPYETIAFKIPNKEIERDTQSGKFFYHWNKERKIFTLQIHFKETPVSPPHNSTVPTVPNFPVLQQPQ